MQQLTRAQTTLTSCLEDNDFGNKQAPIGDDDIASSITLTGQAVVKQAREIAKDYIKKHVADIDDKQLNEVAIYQDTDSFAADTVIHTDQGTYTAEQLYNKFCVDASTDVHGHEIKNVLSHDLYVKTFDSKQQIVRAGRVKNLVRHKVTKKKYTIQAGGESITMTEDHGCMVYRAGQLIRVSPAEICKGDEVVLCAGVYDDKEFKIIDIDSVTCDGMFQDEYVYDLEMTDDTEHTFFANNILVHNSCYVTLKHLPITFIKDQKITSEAHEHIDALENKLNTDIEKYARLAFNSQDPRFVFKREAIADTGLFLEKKRYVLHVLDDEGIPCDKWKYTGVDVVRTTMPKAIKPYVKRVIETMLTTKSSAATNQVLNEAYDVFNALPIEDISRTSGIKGYEKYANMCNDFKIAKGVPNHVKAAYYYNLLIDKLGLDRKYEKIASGEKIKHFYVQQPNKYGIDCIGYKYKFPTELAALFTPDREKLFEKIVYAAIERFYLAVNWTPRKPSQQVQYELLDLFGE